MEANSEKLLFARTEDLFSLCDKYACARFSPFLDGGEIAAIEDGMRFPFGYNTMYFGGCDGCERMMLGVFPDWEEPGESAFPISVIKFTSKHAVKELSHRDYLGSILSLGIDRNKTGDIFVNGDEAYAFITSDIAEYVKSGINKIGRQGVETEIFDIGAVEIPERQYKTIGAVCASMRADAVVAAAANISRQQSARLIENGKVKINHREILQPSRAVKVNDMLSVRGAGRFIIAELSGETRSGRLHIVLKKFI